MTNVLFCRKIKKKRKKEEDKRVDKFFFLNFIFFFLNTKRKEEYEILFSRGFFGLGKNYNLGI